MVSFLDSEISEKIVLTNIFPGVFTSVLRDYILENSSKVFDRRYRPANFGVDLPGVTSPELAGDMRYTLLATRDRDADAPIYIMKKQKAAFGKRQDLKNIEQEKDAAKANGDTKALRRATHLLNVKRQQLSNLQLMENRRRYFKKVDSRYGLRTDDDDDDVQSAVSEGDLDVSLPGNSETLELAKALKDPEMANASTAELLRSYLSANKRSHKPDGDKEELGECR